jgi:site-specific DNA recombinase
VLCWRDDRLMRHPRVGVALEDALDVGDAQRAGKPKIEIRDATGAVLDRFTLSIKARVWREENKRRAERSRMGRMATLEAGRWPGRYGQLGYCTIKEPGKRGNRIVLADEQEVATVRRIFDLCDTGHSLHEIRDVLIREGHEQKRRNQNWDGQKWQWHIAVILGVLRAKDYTGQTTWNFKDGAERTIEIPRIIEPEQWERCQLEIESHKLRSTRNADGVYLLQGIIRCGECGAAINVRKGGTTFDRVLSDGTVATYTLQHNYHCTAFKNLHPEGHPQPANWSGPALERTVWRKIVDYGIKRPDLINEQVLASQQALQEQGDSLDGDIAHARQRLDEIDRERAFYQRQAGRGKMTEREFDARMEETEEARRYWRNEEARLRELRDETDRVNAGMDYVREFLAELGALPEEQRNEILEAQRKVIHTLCEAVHVYSDGHVRIDGALDGTEAAEFELGTSSPT